MGESMSERTCRGEILLVDDSPASLKLLSLWLEEAGYAVRQAPSGELALWSLQSRHPDLILLDVRMPGLDGFATCRRLKADERIRHIPVIFLSAENETPDRVEGLHIGAVDFIAKNSTREELLARVNTHVTLEQTQKALLRERELLEERVRQRTKEILENKLLLQQVIDSLPDWIYVKDRDSRFLLVNQTMAKAHGAQPAELVGQPDHDLPAENRTASALPADAQTMQPTQAEDLAALSGRTIHSEISSWSETHQEERLFESFKGPLRDADGQIRALLGYRRDITDKRREQAERARFEQQLWQAQKMQAIGQLAGGIAHDFNNLLATIMGFAEFARNNLAQSRLEKLPYYLSEVLQASQMAKELVAQLLRFSRNEQSTPEPLALGPALQEIVRLLELSLGSGMPLHLAVEHPLPPVRISAIQLYQAIMNLAINARDACARQGQITLSASSVIFPAHQVCASCQKNFSGPYLRLSLQDNGPGIAPEILPNIFDPFFTTKEIGQGTGLGLSVTHGIVHAAGGHVQVHSSPGQGTRFDLYLPAAPETAGQESSHGDHLPDRSPLHARLLVVDDEASIVAFIRELFESLGCTVSAHTDPEEALRIFRTAPEQFDLAILDQAMPTLTGNTLAKALLALHPGLPVILCSGSTPVDANAHRVSSPGRRFLTKPFSCEDLRQAASELLCPQPA